MTAIANLGWRTLGVVVILFSIFRQHASKAIPDEMDRHGNWLDPWERDDGGVKVLSRGKRIAGCDQCPRVCCVIECDPPGGDNTPEPKNNTSPKDRNAREDRVPPEKNETKSQCTTPALLRSSGNQLGGNRVESILNMLVNPNATMIACSGAGDGGNNVTSTINYINEGVMIDDSGNGIGGNKVITKYNVIGGNTKEMEDPDSTDKFLRGICKLMTDINMVSHTVDPPIKTN